MNIFLNVGACLQAIPLPSHRLQAGSYNCPEVPA
jgi:hypothetical protein